MYLRQGAGHRTESGNLRLAQPVQREPLQLGHRGAHRARRPAASRTEHDPERSAIAAIEFAAELPFSLEPVQHARQRGRPGTSGRRELANCPCSAVSQHSQHVLLGRREIKVREAAAQCLQGRVGCLMECRHDVAAVSGASLTYHETR